ncbi:hypothetical protein ACSMXN_12635 [Jatrophihabitans sp. DSM 45814]
MDPTGVSSLPDLDAVRRRRITLRAATEHLKQSLAIAAAEPTSNSAADTRQSAQELQDCLRAHVEATEGLQGFHNDILVAAPRLAHGVETLVREHAQMAIMASDVVSSCDKGSAVENVDSTHVLGTQLVAAIDRHLQHGSDLIYEAFEAELGGED